MTITHRITRGKLFGQDENIYKMYYDDKMNFREICDFYQYKDTKFLKKFFKQNNFTMRPKYDAVLLPVIRENNDEIVNMYISGFSSGDISKIFKVDNKTILNCLRRNNIKIRDGVESKTTPMMRDKHKDRGFYLPPNDISIIIELFKEGESTWALAKKFNCDFSTMRKILNKNGYKSRKVNEKQTERTKEKIKNTINHKYGGYAGRNKILREKFQEKYGKDLTGAMQVKEFFFKQQESGLKFKTVIIDGIEIKYQGYELKCIYKLLSEGYTIEDINIGENKVPIFRYYFNNRNHIYYPDIYIPKDNRIIEVKSQYYYDKYLEKNLIKRDTVLREGFNFDFYIMNKNDKG